MKRIIIAIILFSLCAAGSMIEVFCVSGSVNGYLEQIDGIDLDVKKDKFLSAAEKCEKLEEEWSKTLRTVDAVLIHDYVDQITISISQMKAYAENNSPDMYFSSSETAKKALESIRDSEYPYLENIL